MRFWAWLAIMLALAVAIVPAVSVFGQAPGPADDNIRAELIADGAPQSGSEWMLALHFTPRSAEWHGYWSNPGDAGLGMVLDWDLPNGWTAGEPLYPVPQRLVIGGLMNHVYEGPYTVLVPVTVPKGAKLAPVAVTADYLACTDKICVPQRARLVLNPAKVQRDSRFDGWRAQVAPLLGSAAGFEISGNHLRIGIPLPAAVTLNKPHVFVSEREMGDWHNVNYAAAQTFIREGDMLVAEIPLVSTGAVPGLAAPAAPGSVSGIVSFDGAQGVRFTADPADVPLEGVAPLVGQGDAMPPLALLLLAALAGGLLLNIMPCVFPILSLKALALARAGGDERAARRDAVAYTGGVVLACMALGALLLVLRAGGEQVGWAFQLQEPGVVVALLLLAVGITANFLGLFDLPGLAVSGQINDGGSGGGSSFVTGLLAAFVATPCTGPFMAAALGAALLLPVTEAMLLFLALGLGLALPFLLLGFVPALRRILPRPGPWMETFRRWMALPMALTALALIWLIWRVGGAGFLLFAIGLAVLLLVLLIWVGRRQRVGKWGWLGLLTGVAGIAVLGAFTMPQPAPRAAQAADSMLNPQPFSETALAKARGSGRPVFVWFTADWCVSCKVNERVAIERESTREAFEKADVITLRGDWTLRDAEIARFLASQGAAGVPLYLWYPADGGPARQLPQILTPQLLADLPVQNPAAGRSAPGTGQ